MAPVQHYLKLVSVFDLHSFLHAWLPYCTEMPVIESYRQFSEKYSYVHLTMSYGYKTRPISIYALQSLFLFTKWNTVCSIILGDMVNLEGICGHFLRVCKVTTYVVPLPQRLKGRQTNYNPLSSDILGETLYVNSCLHTTTVEI